MSEPLRVGSGVSQLDRLLGGLFIGDNVIWYDDAGILASVFCLNFVQISQSLNKSIIYVSFDRSPRNLLQKLGPLAEYQNLTVLDCFTKGKGAGSPVFMDFYNTPGAQWPCNIVRVDEPADLNAFMEVLYGLQAQMKGDVRLVFESITGMQELWGGEERFLGFYSHSCPRLYELQTIAYWIAEKNAHSSRLRAQVNQIAQVAIELSVERGTTYLSILKAEARDLDNLHKRLRYWSKDLTVTFEQEKMDSGLIDMGLRLKDLRRKRGLSQTELAKLVGVTPSTISQVESNFIYPSVPTLLKIAEVLYVEVSSLFQPKVEPRNRTVFPETQAAEVKIPNFPEESIFAKILTPLDFEAKAVPYVIEIPAGKSIPSHFFIHKGDELGYLLAGKLRLKMQKAMYTVRTGDVVYLSAEMPIEWENPGPGAAKLLWIKVN
ncbi:MAG: helix-turn-helix domain-containing protein [Deltaproteobacteria bacterium]|nr:helix-turn-helix domain-containing protein [Deltaproteobacteria bacterium]